MRPTRDYSGTAKAKIFVPILPYVMAVGRSSIIAIAGCSRSMVLRQGRAGVVPDGSGSCQCCWQSLSLADAADVRLVFFTSPTYYGGTFDHPDGSVAVGV